MDQFNGVRVFSATMHKDRAMLGEAVTDWLASNRDVRLVDKVVSQSSDSEFHCVTITLFYVRYAAP
jgi:hypothetical protein